MNNKSSIFSRINTYLPDIAIQFGFFVALTRVFRMCPSEYLYSAAFGQTSCLTTVPNFYMIVAVSLILIGFNIFFRRYLQNAYA